METDVLFSPGEIGAPLHWRLISLILRQAKIKQRLTCGFPTIHRPRVLDTIISLRDDLGNVFTHEMRSALKYLEAVRRHLYNVDWADAGSFVGSAITAGTEEIFRD